jgi:hypothetical protein
MILTVTRGDSFSATVELDPIDGGPPFDISDADVRAAVYRRAGTPLVELEEGDGIEVTVPVETEGSPATYVIALSSAQVATLPATRLTIESKVAWADGRVARTLSAVLLVEPSALLAMT